MPTQLLRLLWLTLLTLPGFAWAQVQLEGPQELVALIQPHLPQSERSKRQLHELISEILATEGYFAPQLHFSANATDATMITSTTSVSIRIEPGPRTHVSALDIDISGPLDPEQRAQILDTWRLPVGQAFRQTDWTEAKQSLLAKLLAQDYADAQLSESQALIDAEQHSAHLKIRYIAGAAYLYGDLQIDGLTNYSPELVSLYARKIQPGGRYREEDLNNFQNALQASPYFQRADVRLQRPNPDDKETANHEAGQITSSPIAPTYIAPIQVTLTERPSHRFSLGAGISSNTGARAEFNYGTPNFARRAWDLHSGLRLEQHRQTLFGDIYLPPDAQNRRINLGAVSEISDIQGLRADRLAFGLQRLSSHGRNEQRLGLHWLQERRVPEGAPSVTNEALSASLSWTWHNLDSLIDPREGSRVQLQMAGALKNLLSDTSFFQLSARLQHYLLLDNPNQLQLRLALGQTRAGENQRIPQDYLFRTGGAGSVRGYRYQSLGIQEGRATVGGRILALASAEHTHWLNAQWGIASFIDSGNVSNTWNSFRTATGYGFGGRWRSPAGPLGLDLAYGQRDKNVELHFSLALPF